MPECYALNMKVKTIKISKEQDFRNRVNDAKCYLNNSVMGSTAPIRVMKDVAKLFLINNECSIVGGVVYHYQIKEIGLGVCEIALAPRHYCTHVTKSFTYKNKPE